MVVVTSFLQPLHAEVGALSLLLSSLSLLLSRWFSSPGAIVRNVALLPTVVACDLSRLSTSCINKGKFGLIVNNGHLPSFGFMLLEDVVGLMKCTGVIVTSIQKTVS